MTSPRNARSIFHEAVEKHPPDRWSAFLDGACGSDSRLRREVEALLAAHVGSGHDDETVGHPTEILPGPSERQGATVGPYRLQGVLGQGGMGTVYLAEQTSPVRRSVALKIIKPGLDSREVIARFEAERQALALMDHANIARVFDGGTTSNGRPYFVMELVKGVPITEYCDRNKVPLVERLNLFVTVCQAVQHAHQKGIIHRDIKPSNVLVTVQDGPPVPKVIDFGVAKAMTQELTDKTLVTNFSQIIGTPLYMSPEQAEMSGLDIDTRSDIYSLGVLMYELLTGTTPFDRIKMQQVGIDEMRRIIREEDPPRPSTRISTLGESGTAIALQRRVDSEKLGQIVRGDLDWIVMKAIEKDRTRRYETANAFARDIQRFLSDQPIEARPPSTAYRFRKFARRNRLAITSVTLVTLALLTGTIVSTWLAIKAMHAERLADEALENEKKEHEYAETQRKAAKTEADTSKQVTNFLVGLFEPPEGSNWLGYQTGAVEQMGQSLTAREIVDRGSKRTLEDLSSQPAVQMRMLDTLGYIYRCLGQGDAAEPLLVDALAKRTEALGKDHLDTASSFDHLAGLRYDQGNNVEATRLYREALEIRRKILGNDDLLVADSLANLAFIETQGGNKEAARKYFLESLEIRRKHLPPNHRDIGFSLWGAGWTLVRDHRYSTGAEKQKAFQQAQVYNDEARSILVQHDGGINPGVATCEFLDSEIRRYNGRLAESEPYLRRAVEMDTKLLGENHPLVTALMMEHAVVLYETGKRKEAELIGQRLHTLLRRVYPDAKAIPTGVTPQLAQILFREDAPPEQLKIVVELTEAAVEVKQAQWDKLSLQRGGNARLALEQLIDFRSSFGRRLLLVNRLAEAEEQFARVKELSDLLVKDFGQKKIRDTAFHDFRLLAGKISRSGNLVAALDWYSKAEEMMLSRLTGDPTNGGDFYWFVRHTDHFNGIATGRAWQLFREQKPDDGDRLYVERIARYKLLTEQSPGQPAFLISVGRTLMSRAEFQFHALKQREQALGSLREARDVFSKLPDDVPGISAYASEKAANNATLGKLFGRFGEPAEAEPILVVAVAELRKLATPDAKNAEALQRYVEASRNLAATLLQRKKHAAVAEIDEALAREPQADPKLKLEIAKDFYECGRLARIDISLNEETRRNVVARYDRLCTELAEAAAAQVNDPLALNDLAWRLCAVGPSVPEQGMLAERLVKKSLEISPHNGSFYNTLGAASYRTGNWKAADDAIENSFARLGYQQFAFNAYFKAMAAWQQGRKEEAPSWLEIANLWTLKHSPHDAELQSLRDEASNLLDVHTPSSNDAQTAPTTLELIEKIVAAAPNAAWSYSMRGYEHAELGHWEQAASDFARSTEMLAARWYDWYELALVQLARDDHAQFQRACGEMLRLFSKSENSDIAQLTAWTCAMGPKAVENYATPLATAERMIAAKSNAPLLRTAHAALLYRSGRLQEAVTELRVLETTMGETPEAPLAYTRCFLAMALYDMGQQPEALVWLDKVVAGSDEASGQASGQANLTWNRRLTLKLLRQETETRLGKSNSRQTDAGKGTLDKS